MKDPIWKHLEEGENNDNEFDIYSIMKSDLMREYYKNNIKLSLKGKVLIIINSYIPMKEQLELLKKLYSWCIDEGDKKYVMNMINLYEFFFKIIYHPEQIYPDKKIFFVRSQTYFMSNEYTTDRQDYLEWLSEYTREHDFDIYDSFNDALLEIKYVPYYIDKVNYAYKNEYIMYYVKIFTTGINETTREIADVELKFIDGEYMIHRITLNNLDSTNEFLIDVYDDYRLSRCERFYIPYNNGDKFSIKLPGLDIPFSGKLYKEFDGMDWYSFLHDVEEDEHGPSALELSFLTINGWTPFSIFDFLK